MDTIFFPAKYNPRRAPGDYSDSLAVLQTN